MSVEILNQVVKENPLKATAEQRLPYGEGRSMWELPPCHPPPTVPFPLGSWPMFKENRIAQYSEAVGLSRASLYKLHNKVFMNE